MTHEQITAIVLKHAREAVGKQRLKGFQPSEVVLDSVEVMDLVDRIMEDVHFREATVLDRLSGDVTLTDVATAVFENQKQP